MLFPLYCIFQYKAWVQLRKTVLLFGLHAKSKRHSDSVQIVPDVLPFN